MFVYPQIDLLKTQYVKLTASDNDSNTSRPIGTSNISEESRSFELTQFLRLALRRFAKGNQQILIEFNGLFCHYLC